MRPVIEVIRDGEMGVFRGARDITYRIIHKEHIGNTQEGKPVVVALAYNPEPPSNVWFVCLVLVGGVLLARKSHNQTRTHPNLNGVVDGWCREVGYQLKIITGAAEYVRFDPKDMEGLRQAITNVWPEGITMHGAPALPEEAGERSRANTESAGKARTKRSRGQLELF